MMQYPLQIPNPPSEADSKMGEEVGSPGDLSDQIVVSDEATPRSGRSNVLPYAHRVAGHHAMLLDSTSGRLIKFTDSIREARFYMELKQRAACDNGVERLRPFIPAFFGSCQADVNTPLSPTTVAPRSVVVQLEDLCSGFLYPCVMDLKMGTRPYGFNPTEAKRRSKAAKARQSTTSQLGVRLGGMKLFSSTGEMARQRSKVEGLTLSAEGFIREVKAFVNNARSDELSAELLRQLHQLYDAMESQRTYHFFTTSLLWLYDAAKPNSTARIAVIDFAHTYTRDERPVVDADEGYLLGVKHLIAILTLGEMYQPL